MSFCVFFMSCSWSSLRLASSTGFFLSGVAKAWTGPSLIFVNATRSDFFDALHHDLRHRHNNNTKFERNVTK